MNKSSWRPLFFSGGTALKELAQLLASKLYHSTHIVTTFDSGGSSAQLRKSFAMPAVGDLRNRLLALANKSRINPALLELASYRLPREISGPKAQNMLVNFIASSPIWRHIDPTDTELLKNSLRIFRERMPGSFDARGASIGNLMLTGFYLENGRDLGAAISIFSSIFHIQGLVLPLSAANLHLGALMKNGRVIIGQHLFHEPPATIENVFFTVRLEPENAPIVSCIPPAFPGVLEEIKRSTLICFPMGSYFSSVLLHLLPAGICDAINANPAPKIFIPNSGQDNELRNVNLLDQIKRIIGFLKKADTKGEKKKYIDYVLVDRKNGMYQIDDWQELEGWLAENHIKLLDRPVVDPQNFSRHLPEPLLEVLENIS